MRGEGWSNEVESLGSAEGTWERLTKSCRCCAERDAQQQSVGAAAPATSPRIALGEGLPGPPEHPHLRLRLHCCSMEE